MLQGKHPVQLCALYVSSKTSRKLYKALMPLDVTKAQLSFDHSGLKLAFPLHLTECTFYSKEFEYYLVFHIYLIFVNIQH